MNIGLYVKCPLFLSDLNESRIFRTDFLKILKYQIPGTSVQWNRDLHADGQTDMMKLTVVFRNTETRLK
jgi:hypothetical protein